MLPETELNLKILKKKYRSWRKVGQRLGITERQLYNIRTGNTKSIKETVELLAACLVREIEQDSK